MNKKAVVAAGGAAALAATFVAVPASAAPSALPKPAVTLKEKILGPETPLHFKVKGCGPKSYNEPSAAAPFVHALQKWTYDAKTQTWSTVARGQFWGILKDHAATHTTILVGCAGAQNVEVPIYWDPKYKVGAHPRPTPSPTNTDKPKPPSQPKSIKVTVTPKYFHAGDTLHVAVYRCPAKPTVHSQILTGGAHWTHKGTTWKTPVHVAKGLREGYYKFTVTCTGFRPVVFKVRYGNPGTPSKPAKHTPGHQSKYIPNGSPQTGGGSTARTFV